MTNARSVLRWLKETADGRPALEDAERLTTPERMREFLLLGLRMNDGIRKSEFREIWGCDMRDVAAAAIDRNTYRGWLEEQQDTLRLTPDGRFFADTVATDLL